jgi:hypothetical protein
VPPTPADPDSERVELGVKFKPAVNGVVTGVRFYKGAGNTGAHMGSLWTGTTRTSTVAFIGETANGWQTALFPDPVIVKAGTEYVASYLAPVGRYALQGNYPWPKTTGNLTGVGSVFRYGGGYPTETYGGSNYFVDPLFIATGTPTAPTTAPTTVSTTASATPTSTTATATTTAPPVQPALLDLPRIPWEGGPAYWAQFPKANAAGWDDPSFFPISVFFGKPSHANQLKAVGVNTYMGAEHDGSTLASITNTGMFVLPQREWTSAEVGDNPRAVGWHVSDECEMGLDGCDGGDEYTGLAKQKTYVDGLRAKNDGRFLQANFGNGVLRHYWSFNTMDDHVALMDASSVDKYAYTSPNVHWVLSQSPDWISGANPKSAGSYGWLQDQMERFQDQAKLKPNWVFVEVARPYLGGEVGAGTITPEQLDGAAWQAIIHEARGIAYFQHNDGPACGNYSLVDCDPARLAKITATNAKITALAPVINTQSYEYNTGSGVDTMTKAHNGSAYIFAGIGLNQPTGSKTFTLPAGVTGTTVEVVGEGRSLPVTGGKFTDTFAAEYTSHVYRITI